MAQESPSTTRLFVFHGGQETGPLQFRDVMDRLRVGLLALDDLCRLEGAEDRAPLRVVLPKLGPPLPTPSARPSTAQSAPILVVSTPTPVSTSANLRPPERIFPSAEPPSDASILSSSAQDVASTTDDKAATDVLHQKVVIRPTPSPQPPSTALSKTTLRMWRWLMWGCVVAAALLACLLVFIAIPQRRSPPGPQPNVPTPVPTVTAAPTVASPPSRTPDQRAYGLTNFLLAKQAFEQHDLATARKLIDVADSEDPNKPAILNLRGEILTEQKEYELAEAAFRKAIEIDPYFYEAKKNLASMLWKKDAEKSLMPSPTVTPQISPAESPTVVKRMTGERFPETRSWLMTSWEVEKWTPEQLRYAINEMYARHGADFLDKQIKRQFSTFEWYHPRSGQTYDQTEKLFSTVELYNLKLLGFYRDARKAGPSPGSPSGGSSPPSDSTQQQTARKPKFVYAPHPTYPPNADKMHVTGSGRFKITFDEGGNAKSVEIVQSTGNRALDSNTIKTLKLWRVAPGSPFYVVVPIDYRQKRQTRPKPRANTSGHYQIPVPQTLAPPGGYAPEPPPQHISIDPHGPR